ncbi:hypothetical protein WR25_01852 [Diploscapter pachys]|uniref:AH domain-containing protein n=1 Tax=Diploscapter pachys TaxID=2018661 RepID=A0A2A2JDC5_9BILA|nr:hypothetical protein WR25_01852 [Diploscapter pachys]
MVDLPATDSIIWPTARGGARPCAMLPGWNRLMNECPQPPMVVTLSFNAPLLFLDFDLDRHADLMDEEQISLIDVALEDRVGHQFYQELQVFNERAIVDCTQTVDAAERARTEYRGSLLWMKKTSDELDPDTNRQMEKFREAQTAVRGNKERLDRLKGDVLQKVDLLAASRSNLLAHLLGKYYESLSAFYGNTAKAYTALAANLSVFQHYEFEILTDLIEPSKKVARKVRQESLDKEGKEKSRQPAEVKEEDELGDLLNLDDEPDNSLKKYLFGRDSPVEEKKNEDDKSSEEQRTDSPLGEFLEQHETKQSDEGVKNREINIGPLLPLVDALDTNASVPKLPPPPAGSANIPGSTQAAHSGHFVSQDLFPLMKKKEPVSEGLADLLSLAASSSNVPAATSAQFINPFSGEQPSSEWDSLLAQCDQQQSIDLL